MGWFAVLVCGRKPVPATHGLPRALGMENFKNADISRGGLDIQRSSPERQNANSGSSRGKNPVDRARGINTQKVSCSMFIK